MAAIDPDAAMPTLDVSAVDTTLARNEGIENGSDLHLPNFNLADKLRTTISAGADAVKQGVKKVFGGKEDFKHLDFLETCKAADKQLRKLDFKYTQLIVYGLDETQKQFKEKQILISVFGRQNTGKSTLLNSHLKARLLPMKELAETGAKVLIQHNGDVSHLVQSTDTATVENSGKCPILYLECKEQQSEEKVKGVEYIYRRLQSLNANAHKSDKAVLPKCTLKTCVPFLADAPSEWNVSLVDTPGFGEFDSCVEALAKEALKSSSVCVYITAYNDLRAQASGDYLKFMLQHDPGVFEGNRLIIVITKFDQQSGSAELSDTNEEITAEEAKKKTCQFVREICPSAKISHDDVLPVSGRWAYHARMLANSCKWEPTHNRCQSNVRKCLADVPNRMCGQGEDPYASLEDSKLSAELEKASGISVLEARIEAMTKSCFQIWVSKMTGDYDRYLTQAVEKMKEASSELAEDIKWNKEHQKSKQDCLEAITVLRGDLEATMKLENSRVYVEISAKYQEDLEKSQPQQSGKDVVHEMMVTFQSRCYEKVRDRKLQYGPLQLKEDVHEFLKNTEKELDKTFNSNCAFKEIYQVLIHHSGDMRATVERMRGKARELCGSPPTECTGATEESEDGVQEDIPPETPNLAEMKNKSKIPSLELAAPEIGEGGVQEDMKLEAPNLGDNGLAGAEGGLQESIKPWAPNLGYIKDKVEIPPVSLSIWDKFADQWREVGDLLSTCFPAKKSQAEIDDSPESSDSKSPSATKPSEPSTYRRWDQKLKSHIETLQKSLEDECDAYFVKIQNDAIKYFHGQYCQETRAQLELFDKKFKKNIDEQLKKLKNNIDVKCKEKQTLDDLCTHFEALKAHLHDAAGKYLKKWQVA